MKKTSLRTTLCCIACTLLAASAWAQREPGSTTPGSQTPSSSSSSQRSSQGGLGSQSQRSSAYSSSMGQQAVRVSQQVINAQVKTQDGQPLGQIEDLIANPQTGKIEFAVVSKGDKLCPIPMQLLHSQGGSSASTPGTTDSTTGTPTTTPGTGRGAGAQGQKMTFVAQVDKSKLEQAPSFSRTQWPEMSSTWSQQIYSHYGVTPEATGGTGSSSSSTQGKSSSGTSTSDPSKSDPSKSSSSSDTQKKSNQKSEN